MPFKNQHDSCVLLLVIVPFSKIKKTPKSRWKVLSGNTEMNLCRRWIRSASPKIPHYDTNPVVCLFFSPLHRIISENSSRPRHTAAAGRCDGGEEEERWMVAVSFSSHTFSPRDCCPPLTGDLGTAAYSERDALCCSRLRKPHRGCVVQTRDNNDADNGGVFGRIRASCLRSWTLCYYWRRCWILSYALCVSPALCVSSPSGSELINRADFLATRHTRWN